MVKSRSLMCEVTPLEQDETALVWIRIAVIAAGKRSLGLVGNRIRRAIELQFVPHDDTAPLHAGRLVFIDEMPALRGDDRIADKAIEIDMDRPVR
jgi:hypothetical protein